MVSKSRFGRAFAALGALTGACLASHAHAQCIGYGVAPVTSTYVQATNDIGLYADDGTAPISLPFPVNFYGTAQNAATVSSNGTLQFTTNSTAYANNCLPSATFAGPTIMPFWDDLYTVGGGASGNGCGVFTDTIGTAPSRTFIIEWRTGYCCTQAAPINTFELKFFEGQDNFEVVYGTPMSDRSSATIGCQDGAGVFTQFVCNAAGPAAGTALRFTCATAQNAGACCNVAAGTCNISTQAACAAPNIFSGVGSTCPANCPQPGACCDTASGVCTQTGAAGCLAPSTFSGVGSTCNPNPCVGACCNASTGNCTSTTASGCAAPNTFQGLGFACNPNPCPQEACCNASTAACTIAAAGACPAGTNGQGVGSTCNPNNCPAEACCNVVTGACTTAGPGACTGGLTGQGPGSSCNPNPCPQPPPPANDNCADVVAANAPVIPGIGGVVMGNNSTATTDGGATCGGSGTKDVYFLFTPATGGDWKFETCGTTPLFDTVISIHSSCPADASTQLVCNDDFCGLLSTVTAPGLSAGSPVIVRVATFGTGTGGGVFQLTVSQLQSGACCDAGTGACASTTTGQVGCPSGSTFQGVGTACSPNPCPQPPTGACCLANTQTCSEIPSASCTQQGGTYQGNNTTCGAAPCPFGACCLGCVGCFTQTSAGCAASGGTYQGDGSACTGQCAATGTNVVANGDFEAGLNFSGWTQFGDTGFTAVGAGAWQGINPHGGNNHAHFGPTGNVGGIQQVITANPGDHVTIAFWYACTGTNNSFVARFDGQPLVSFANDTAHPNYTLFVFNVTVVNANPTLRFECFNPPLYVYLDDIVACVTTGGSGGVCCRGSTCTTAVTSTAACSGSLIGGQSAGASFPSGSGCNAGASTTSPCCYADYNKTSGITVQDIFDFLNDWFASSPYANFGGTGAPGPLAVQNIFDYLNAWFAGGC